MSKQPTEDWCGGEQSAAHQSFEAISSLLGCSVRVSSSGRIPEAFRCQLGRINGVEEPVPGGAVQYTIELQPEQGERGERGRPFGFAPAVRLRANQFERVVGEWA